MGRSAGSPGSAPGHAMNTSLRGLSPKPASPLSPTPASLPGATPAPSFSPTPASPSGATPAFLRGLTSASLLGATAGPVPSPTSASLLRLPSASRAEPAAFSSASGRGSPGQWKVGAAISRPGPHAGGATTACRPVPQPDDTPSSSTCAWTTTSCVSSRTTTSRITASSSPSGAAGASALVWTVEGWSSSGVGGSEAAARRRARCSCHSSTDGQPSAADRARSAPREPLPEAGRPVARVTGSGVVAPVTGSAGVAQVGGSGVVDVGVGSEGVARRPRGPRFLRSPEAGRSGHAPQSWERGACDGSLSLMRRPIRRHPAWGWTSSHDPRARRREPGRRRRARRACRASDRPRACP